MTTESGPSAKAAQPGEPLKAGFTARDAAEDDSTVATKKQEAREKAAFARAAEDQEDSRVGGQGGKPGFAAAPAPATSPVDNKADDKKTSPSIDLRGKGWIYCGRHEVSGRGTWIKDCGEELYAPYSKANGMSNGQKMMIRSLAQQKGWTTLCAVKKDGHTVDVRAAHEIMSAGLPCCTVQSMVRHIDDWKAAHRQNLQALQNRAASNAPDLKAQA